MIIYYEGNSSISLKIDNNILFGINTNSLAGICIINFSMFSLHFCFKSEVKISLVLKVIEDTEALSETREMYKIRKYQHFKRVFFSGPPPPYRRAA